MFRLFEHEYAFDPGFKHGYIPAKDRTHTEITNCALYGIIYDYIETKYGTQNLNTNAPSKMECSFNENILLKIFNNLNLKFDTVKNTIKTVALMNRFTDINEQHKKEAHFDSESFKESAIRLIRLKSAGIHAIKNGDFYNARCFFGRLFHTAQDFYSHSNWVEFDTSSPNLYLTKSTDLGIIADEETEACLACSSEIECKNNINPILLKNKILTSGYFGLLPLNQKPRGKCSHGGFFDSTKLNSFDGINKDKLSSPHGHLHYEAARLAVMSTFNILRDLRTEIGDADLGQFLGFNGITTAFVFETDDDFDKKKDVSIQIMKIYESMTTAHNFIFSTSNVPFINANSLKDFETKIGKADINPQKSDLFERVINTINFCEQFSIIFLHADILLRNKDVDDRILPLAINKNIIINVIFDVSNPLNNQANVETELERIVRRTGGFVMYLSKIINLPYLINKDINPDPLQNVIIMDFNEITEKKYKNFFYIDKSYKNIYISVSSNNKNNRVAITDPLKETFNLIGINDDGKISLDKPMTGKWEISIKGSYLSLKINGISNFSITSNLYINNTVLNELLELKEPPIIGDTLVVLSKIPNEFVSKELEKVSIDIVTQSSDVISTYFPYEIIDGLFFTSFVVPSQGFRIKFNCINHGENVERYEAILFQPTLVDINIDENTQYSFIFPGEDYNITYSIQYKLENDIVLKLVIQDTLKLIFYEKIIQIGSDKENTVTFSIPDFAKSFEGQVDMVTVLLFDVNINTNETISFETLYVTILQKDFESYGIHRKMTITRILMIFLIILLVVIILYILQKCYLMCKRIKRKSR